MTKKESNFEGREDKYLDVDRMINEGLAGGLVHSTDTHTNIEEARDLTNETPPNHN